MTSSQIPQRKAFSTPFASGGEVTALPDTGGTTVNMYDGFPSVYSAPGASGGKYVSRGDINAIGNLATNDLFYHKCGGLNTFDAAFAEKVGGYPKGAVLDYIDGTNISKVMSLIDNNTVDFTVAGVDGVNWANCNVSEPTRDRLEMLSLVNVPVGTDLSTTAVATPVGAFYATKSGALIADMQSEVTMAFERSEGYYPSSSSSNAICGAGVVVIELNDESGYSSLTFPTASQIAMTNPQWKLLTEDTFGTTINLSWTGCSVTGRILNISSMRARAGKYYVIAVLAGSCTYGVSSGASYVLGTVTTKISSLRVFID